MLVKEKEGTIHFIHSVVEGATNRSYGIYVARLAGMPREVIERAEVILSQLQNKDSNTFT